MISRPARLAEVRRALARSPVAALLGPRQCGKTTLARELARTTRAEYFDLEHEEDLARLSNPMTALGGLHGLAIIDEVQRSPELFPALRVLADRPGRRCRYLLLGSASPSLIKGASETLAGRIAFVELGGIDLEEAGSPRGRALWLRGGLPRSLLARTDAESSAWRRDFISTFLERDIPQLGVTIPAASLRRFWTMLAQFHGQVWNAAELARSIGGSEPTARRYLDLLTGAYMVRQLPPWYEYVGKRQVKAPKIYLRDTGLLHRLLGIRDFRGLTGHPRAGASWEGFAVEQIARRTPDDDLYFWATHAGAELDVFFRRGKDRIGLEIKYSEGPRVTRSMRAAIETLRLTHLFVVYPGRREFRLDRNITVLPLDRLRSATG